MILKNELVNFWRDEHRAAGYGEIQTPQILHEKLWHQSGHWQNYKENMYFTKIDEQSFAVKPMNCPGGMLVYKTSQKSYRDLPLRVGELGIVHRHELSGVLHGLFRVRVFTQDDAHIFCTRDQVEDELLKVIKLEEKFYKKFGFKFHVELSTRPEKRVGAEEIWDLAESTLEKVIKKSGLEI
jgi:Threonyl-tRNA synthetase